MSTQRDIPVDAYFFISAHGKIYRFHFKKILTLIGRDKSNDIVMKDPNLQTHHAQVTFTSGQFVLRPIENSFIKVNGEKIEDPTVIENGDLLSFGDIEAQLAVNNGLSDAAAIFIIRKGDRDPFWFISNKSRVIIGSAEGQTGFDYIFDDPAFFKGSLLFENYAENCHLISKYRGDNICTFAGEQVVERVRLKAGDRFIIGEHIFEVYFVRSVFMENPEESLSETGLKRFRLDYISRKPSYEASVLPVNPYQKDVTESELAKSAHHDERDSEKHKKYREDYQYDSYEDRSRGYEDKDRSPGTKLDEGSDRRYKDDLEKRKKKQMIDDELQKSFKKGGHTSVLNVEDLEKELEKDKK
jgi:pSer/pThr/pTyr-binding forkhead associated (FHA) protein